jgi:hypothetical protein
MSFSRWLFRIAGIYGLIALVPQYFMEGLVAANNPPPITHPEYFYGFLGVAIAWQVVFLLIARDPARFRSIMIPAVVEKFSFAGAAILLFMNNRLRSDVLAFGFLDLILGILFIIAFMKTAEPENPPGR